MKLVKTLAEAGFVAAVPVFLVAVSVAWAVNDPGLYQRGFQKYDIARRTGITQADLLQVGADLRRYFNSAGEPLLVSVPVHGEVRPLYSQRETLHMRDVKQLVRGVYLTALLTGGYLLLLGLAGFIRERGDYWPTLARLLLYGGALTLGLTLTLGLFALLGFERMFLLFHQLSFRNDLWQLNPYTDYLLIMFPAGFWFDATMRIALTTVAGAALLSVSGGYGLYRAGRLTWPPAGRRLRENRSGRAENNGTGCP